MKEKICSAVGSFLFIAGMAAGESKNLMYPLVMMLAGAVLIFIALRNKEALGV